MADELVWTDTAREDWEGVGTAGEALLARVASSPGDDHVLTAAHGFELRYQKQDGLFLFFRREPGKVTILYVTEMPAAQPPGEASVRVLDLQTREVPNGLEAEGTYAFTAEDGTTTVRHHYVRRVELGNGTTLSFFHMAAAGKPPFTAISTAKRGPIEGDFRYDEIEMTRLHADGTVQRLEPRRVPVWIKDPLEGLSPEERQQRLVGFLKDVPRTGISAEELASHMRRWRELR